MLYIYAFEGLHGLLCRGFRVTDTYALSIYIFQCRDVETGITLVAEHRHSPGDLSIIK